LNHLCCRRAALANDLRATRKRNVVPVLLSVLWFLVSMAVSIEKAFRNINYDAFDLSLGLLMSWLPVVVACAVVDGGPTSSGHTRQALQRFLDTAASAAATLSLRAAVADLAAADHKGVNRRKQHCGEEIESEDGDISTAYTFRSALPLPKTRPAILLHDSTGPAPWTASSSTKMARLFLMAMQESSFNSHQATWHSKLDPPPQQVLDRLATMPLAAPLVQDFCSQGRQRWHRGLAPLLLTQVQLGLRDLPAARPQGRGLLHWLRLKADGSGITAYLACLVIEIVSLFVFPIHPIEVHALFAVFHSTRGAVTIHDDLPANFLCRSASYSIYQFFVLVAVLLKPLGGHLSRRPQILFGQTSTSTTTAGPAQPLHALMTAVEIIGSTWLLIILLGQPLGLFNSCACHPMRYGAGLGNYIILESNDTVRQLLDPYRFARAQVKAIIFGCLPLLLVPYAVHAWCTQSFLSSPDHAEAMRSLQRVQYVFRGEWCASAFRAARHYCRRRNSSTANATAEGDRGQAEETYETGKWILKLCCQSPTSRTDDGSRHRC
jgi:hypothetical protein